MRVPAILLTLTLTLALSAGLATRDAQAGPGDPSKPAADEVILHADPYFGSGASERYKLGPKALQLTIYLRGQLLDRKFRSVQVGRDVIANVYRARPDNPAAGYDGKQLLHSEMDLAPNYSILVVNRKADGRANQGYRDLPFRVTIFAQWKTLISGGRLHMDEYFVPPTAQHPNVHDVSSVLQPSDQGADFFSLHTGRFPTNSIAVTFFDQPRAQGTNTRTFPTAPGYAAGYSFWDFGYGDKARSLRITWKGLEFGSATIPGVPVPTPTPTPGPKPQFVVPDVKGFWLNPIGWRYEIGTNGKFFAWKLPVLGETGNGWFENSTDIVVRWISADGKKHGPVKGKVKRDASWRATQITLANGLVLRPATAQPKPQPTPPTPKLNLSGTWSSKYGKVVLQHQGSSIKGTLHYPSGGTASLQGTIQGQLIQVTWSANALAHGHGTFTIAPDGRKLSGPFIDVVSKGGDIWELTR